jgi:glycosyltransferase involved in cell wall biosynthesis
MQKILFVLSHLEYCGAAKEVALLASGLPRDRFEPRVCILGNTGPASVWLAASGASVSILEGTRLINVAAYRRLRRLIRDFQPDIVHAWGLSAYRIVAVTAGRGPHRLLVSAPFPAGGRKALGRLESWLLRRADRILARSPAEAEWWQGLGLRSTLVEGIPPGVEVVGQTSLTREAHPSTNQDGQVHAGQRLVVCVGPLEPHKGYLDAVWSFDILHYLYDNVRLVVAGSGPARPRLEEFAQATGAAAYVDFIGPQADIAPWLTRAEVVWVPGRATAGVHVALEAMALGRPVVAARLPCLADLVADGETGYLVAPGDKVGLARQTRLLLDSADLRRRLGEAGRRRVTTMFPAAAFIGHVAELYERLGRALPMTG